MWFLSPSGWPTWADDGSLFAISLAEDGYTVINDSQVQPAVDAYNAQQPLPPAAIDYLTEAEAAERIAGTGPLGVAARAAFVAPERLSRPNTWAAIGDSLSAQSVIGTNAQGGKESSRRSYHEWANVSLGQRLEPPAVFAVTGKQTDAMVTEQLPQVLDLSPRPAWCTVLGGTNDINNGRTAAQVIASLRELIEGLTGAGIRPIVGTITPRTGFTAGQLADQMQVNRWIKQVVPSLGAIVVDWSPFLANADGTPKTNVLQDGLHQTSYGASLMGQALASALTSAVAPADRLPASNAESPTPNILTNPLLTGTTGTLGTGATGQVATSWFGYGGTFSKVARTDGIPGEWQQVVPTADPAQIQMRVTSAMGRWVAGDTLEGFIEYELDAISGATNLEALINGISGASSTALRIIGGDTYTGPLTSIPTRGVIRVPPLTITDPTTEVWLIARVAGTTDGTATVRFGRAFMGKVA